MKELKGKIAVITGASQGIGKAISMALAAEGCVVVLLARGKEALEKTVKEILKSGSIAEGVTCDVSDFEKLSKVIKATEKKYGRIDILVNNAGVGTFKPLQLTSVEEAIGPVQIPFGSSVVACQTVIPGMLSRKSGHIVNLTSPAGYFPLPNMMSYAAARHAIVGLSLSLSVEMKKKGVGVSLMCPGQVDTGYFQRNDADISYFPRISKIFPVVQPDAVGKRVISAIKRNQEEVIFPFVIWFMVRFYQTLPRFTFWFLNLFGLMTPSRKS